MRQLIVLLMSLTLLTSCEQKMPPIIEATPPIPTITLEVPKLTSTTTVEVIKNEVESEMVEIKPFFYLTDYERRVTECMVMGESGGESYEGQLMVAFCILNACLKDGLQPSEVRVEYQYSGWKENPSDSVKRAVKEIFDDGYAPIDDTPMFFYAPKRVKRTPWHETQRYICTIGGHKFFGEWN